MVFDWVSFFQAHGIRFNTEGHNLGSGWIGLDRCPFCGGTDNKIGFSLEHGGLRCWRCSSHSKLDTIIALLGCTREQGLIEYHKYKDGNSYTPIDSSQKTNGVTKVELPGNSFTKPELDYMCKRGLTDYHVKTYDLRSGGLFGFFAYRIVIPVYVNSRIVSATGRSISKTEELRYKTLPATAEIMPHKHTLLCGDLAKEDTCCVVEGAIDSLLGGPGFVSTYGTTVTDEQIYLLSKRRRVFVAFDNDDPGRVAGNRLSNILSTMGVEVILVSWSDNGIKDLGDMTEDDRRHLRMELFGL